MLSYPLADNEGCSKIYWINEEFETYRVSSNPAAPTQYPMLFKTEYKYNPNASPMPLDAPLIQYRVMQSINQSQLLA